MQVKKQQLAPVVEQQTGSNLGKEYVMAVYCHTTYLASMPSILREMLGWMKHKLKSRLLGGISITSDVDNTILMAEREENPKSLWMKMKEESKKVGFKLNIQKIKIMASGLITPWQIDGGNNGNSDRIYFLGLQNITAKW